VDAAILSDLDAEGGPARLLNDRLLGDLRPTLFLAQLSNLLAGNISIVHGVTGSSRTFMGEESAGADAVRIACARIAAGQGEVMLVGGSYNAQRPDVMLHYALGGMLAPAPFTGVWSRLALGGGIVPGSIGCFLVIESRAHAARRGATALARIVGVLTARSRRTEGVAAANARAQFAALAPHIDRDGCAVISGASGVAEPTRQEVAFLAELGLPVRATATAIGHGPEPSFPASLALAAMAVRNGTLFAPLEANEGVMPGPLQQALVTSWGLWRGEAMALVGPA